MEKFDPIRIDGERVRGQVGALCYRVSPKGSVEVLLVTSRDTGRWVIPKGWPMPGRSAPAAAAREAFEEAGVVGKAGPDPLGIYTYLKGLPGGHAVTCVVSVFGLRVDRLRSRFPEAAQRTRRWLAPHEAALEVHEPELAELLRGFPATLPSQSPGSVRSSS
jgi:8-oxo-dGTP pyrophosphatase MutT (NUDIX family)